MTLPVTEFSLLEKYVLMCKTDGFDIIWIAAEVFQCSVYGCDTSCEASRHISYVLHCRDTLCLRRHLSVCIQEIKVPYSLLK